MATKLDSSIFCSSSSATLFRAWCNFIRDTFLLGFVQTADTGQANLATISAPTGYNESTGFQIYRTNDGLTAVYVKVEFGSSQSGPTNPAIWFTVGTATNGAGVIAGSVLVARTQLSVSVDAVTQHICFGSGANNRICFAMFLSALSTPWWFSLERLKDADIADVDTGVVVDWGNGYQNHKSLCAPFSGIIPTPENGMQFVLSSNNPAAYGDVIPEGLRIPMLGSSEYPGRNIAVCMANDFSAFAEPTLRINVTDHKFKHCGLNINTLRGGSSGVFDAATRLLLRYD
jgi:hypothetical protein